MRYNKENCSVEMSAAYLCMHFLKKGDLGGSMPSLYEAESDGELYFRLQSEAGAYYNPKVELTNTVCVDGMYITVCAYADGIIRKESGDVVDKIKCVSQRGFSSVPDQFTLAMLKCSAYFYAVREGLPFVRGRVSFYDTGRKKLKYFKYSFKTEELKSFYQAMIEKIKYRARLVFERETKELPFAANAPFPYSELREGQERMIRESFFAAKRGKRIFVEAPTGTGKTISSLFPAVRALGNGYCDKIFYLTPKMSARREAFSAAAKLHEAGCMQRTVMITAKEQVCPYSGGAFSALRRECNAECCECARGYYDRVEDALREMLENYRGYSGKLICETARKYKLCPYELSLDLSELCDIIICDYNYAFDMSVYFRRYFGAKALSSRRILGQAEEKYFFLIDEAHNLLDRTREMYSVTFSSKDLDLLSERASGDIFCSELEVLCSSLSSEMKKLRRFMRDEIVKDENGRERGFYISSVPPESIERALTSFVKKGEQWKNKNEDSVHAEMFGALLADAKKYLALLEFFDESFRFYAMLAEESMTLRLYCIDPSSIMDKLLSRARGAVLFSATLTPTDYFCKLLGGKRGEGITLPSPFLPDNLCVAVADYVNMRFEEREKNAKKFATVIAATVSKRAGNYIAYFPSYACLEVAYEAFAKKYPHVKTVVQKKHMREREREEFLSAFKEDTGHLRVGFCVLGGVFSEGVDLPGSRLIGSIIFGVGLPGISNEKNIVKEYFDTKGEDGMGYDYAYTFPGMNNVLQAAGRVIRREDDRGVVVLADDRYATAKYRELFPAHWQGVQYAGNASSLAEIIRRFWEKE